MGAHIRYDKVESVTGSDDGYYPVAAQVGKRANKRAIRSDITAVIGAEAGMGAPACFIPSLAELHINTESCDLGDPDKVDFSDVLWLHTHAPAVGAVSHEAAHARHTRWEQADLEEAGATPRIMDVIVTLEEPRIEACAMREHPDDKMFLRGVALEIVGKDFHISDTPYGAATAAGLLLARVDAKTVTRRETAGFRKDILAVLGKDVLGDLTTLWQRFLRLHDTDYAGMVHIADAWLTIIGIDPEDDGSDEDSEPMAGGSMMGEGDPSDGDGDGDGDEGDSEGKGSGFGKAIKGKVMIAESKVDGEHVGAAGDEKAKRRADEREADAARKREGEHEHGKAFRKGGLHGWSPDGFAHYTGSRTPTDAERRAAKSLARTLELIDYRDRAVTKVKSMVPPGRLRGRAAVQAGAYAERGATTEVEVWQGKRRRKVDSTPLTIGFMVDVSGSMGSAMEPLGSSQWVVSTAGTHVDARVATVHYGSRVHAVAPVGFREREVRLFHPGDGTEEFRAGALALDSELNLLDSTGARILFVASDGHYVDDKDMAYSQTFNRLAARKGVAVIYLNFTGYVGGGTMGAAQVIDCEGKSPAEVATLCGKAAIAELRRLDARV
jgi:hypothetical protein